MTTPDRAFQVLIAALEGGCIQLQKPAHTHSPDKAAAHDADYLAALYGALADKLNPPRKPPISAEKAAESSMARLKKMPQ